MKNKVILIIDDDEMNLQIAKMILERKLGCKVIGADNGVEGIEILKSRRVNLVLLDVMMPDFDGVETLQEIRHDEQIKNVPVMMLTASGEIETIQKVGVLGVKDYIKKPFMPADLIERVSKKLAEQKPSAEVLLIGDDEKILREMERIIAEKFNHGVTRATKPEEILDAEATLIIACADMKFINALNFLNVLEAEEKFKSVPLAVTTPEKLSELLDKINQPEIEEKPAINIRRLGRAVTSFIGYELDTKV
ncbi:MAG: response regulator [Selenomonadaceae bacterium]|nr:response regulator [Selenomonadaceae bacterium]MBR6887820.1 response regulator [Selenomonadaceae bacterium]